MAKTPYQLSLDEKKQVWDATNPRIVVGIQSSVQYGTLAIRSAFLLNGGLLFALPTFVVAIHSGTVKISASDILWPSTCFVAGILFAAVCCLVAYLNFQWNSHHVELERLKEFSEIEEGYDDVTKHRLAESRELYRQELDEIKYSLQGKINKSFVAGVTLAVLSYVSFILGCVFSAQIFLSI